MQFKPTYNDVFTDSPLRDKENIIEVLNETSFLKEVNTYGESLGSSASRLIAKFHSIHENRLYHGYDNYDKINRVAKLFEKKAYIDALRESECDNIKTFVENERETINQLRDHITADLKVLAQYRDVVDKALNGVKDFLSDNKINESKDKLSFDESILKGKLIELEEMKESLLHIQSVNEVAIKFAIEGKNTLTVASDGILQNISMISVIGEGETKEIWSGNYKEEVKEDNNVNDNSSRVAFWTNSTLTLFNIWIGTAVLFSHPDKAFTGAVTYLFDVLYLMLAFINVYFMFMVLYNWAYKGFSIKNELKRTFSPILNFFPNRRAAKKEFRKVENAESDILVLSEDNNLEFLRDVEESFVYSSAFDFMVSPKKYDLVRSDSPTVQRLSQYRLFTPVGDGKKSIFTPERANIVFAKENSFIEDMIISLSKEDSIMNFMDNNSPDCNLLKSMRVIKSVGKGVKVLVPDVRFEWYLGLRKKVNL